MLIISLVSTIVYLAVVSFSSPIVSSVHYIRVSVMVAFICLALGTYLNVESVNMYHSLFYYSSFTIVIDTLLYLILTLAFSIDHTDLKAYACFNTFVIAKRVITFNDSLIFSAKHFIALVN